MTGREELSDWKAVTLDDACDVIMGQSPPGSTYNKEGKGLPFFQGKSEFGSMYPTASTWCSAPKKTAEPNDILISVRAPVGPTNLSNIKCCIGRGLTAIRPKTGIEPKYVLYYLRSIEQDIASLGSGSTFQSISKSHLANIEILLAPESQQRLIVAEIEKQFSRLDEAVAGLKRIKANLKRYKAAVLKAAVEGKLTVEIGKHGYGAVNHAAIDSAIESLDQGWSPRCENESSTATDIWGVIKTTAVQPLQYREHENKRLPAKLNPRRNLELVAGDLLITRAGPRSRVGVACLIKKTRPHLLLCDKVYRLRARNDIALPDYLAIVLSAPHIVDALNELKTGISDSGVNLTQQRFRELVIPLPSLHEQRRIVTEVERSVSVIEEIDAGIEANLKRAEHLRQSILKDAFSGRLTT